MTDTIQTQSEAGGTDGPDGADTEPAGETRWLSEAERRDRVDAWRAETQSPWEAGIGGLLVWGLWRTLYKGVQPAWLVGSLLIAGYYLLTWLDSAGGVDRLAAPQPDRQARIEAALSGAVPDSVPARRFWSQQMEGALMSGRRREADIDLFRAWARIGPDLITRDQLALDMLAGAAGPDWLDARLRAGAPGERERQLSRAIAQALREGQAHGLVPPELVFADPGLVARYQASQFRWSVAQASAQAFFRRQQQGEFAMRSLPGLVAPDIDGPARLYGGVRHLMIQACAGTGPRLEGCGARIIPGEAPDDLRLALAALESGLVQLHIPSSAVRNGAETLQAAREAGRLSPALEAQLSAHLSGLLPAGLVRETLARDSVRADLAFAAPDRTARTLYHRLDLRTAEGAVALSELLRELDALREATSPVLAIRLMSGLEAYEDVTAIRALAGVMGEGTLAARQLLGPQALTLLETTDPIVRPGDPVAQRNAMLALISAACVLLLTLIRLITPRHIRRASWSNLADAWISRLTLGRKT